MSGVTLKFTLKDLPLRKEMTRRVEQLENPEPLLKSIGEEMLPRVLDRFKQERGPDGKRWAPLASATIRARLKKYGNSPLTILRMRGHLAGAINYQTSPTTLKIGTGNEVKDYAAIHQLGGKAGRGRKVTIKARPFLGFSDGDMAIIEEEVTDYFIG